MLPVPAVLLAMALFLDLADGQFRMSSLALLGGLLSSATLINQAHVIFVVLTPIAIVAAWYERRGEIPARDLVRGLASYGTVATLIIGVAYFGVTIFVLGLRDLPSIINWSKGYAGAPF